MCRTDQPSVWLAVGVGMWALMLGQAQAQTLGDVAEAQRAKALAEITAAQVAANPPAPNPQNTKGAAVRKPARPTSIVLHSLYRSGAGEWTAELTDGETLAVALPGMRHGKYVVTRIDEQGVHLSASDACKRECPRARTVRLGGEL